MDRVGFWCEGHQEGQLICIRRGVRSGCVHRETSSLVGCYARLSLTHGRPSRQLLSSCIMKTPVTNCAGIQQITKIRRRVTIFNKTLYALADQACDSPYVIKRDNSRKWIKKTTRCRRGQRGRRLPCPARSWSVSRSRCADIATWNKLRCRRGCRKSVSLRTVRQSGKQRRWKAVSGGIRDQDSAGW